jgi:hypothetical protein
LDEGSLHVHTALGVRDDVELRHSEASGNFREKRAQDSSVFRHARVVAREIPVDVDEGGSVAGRIGQLIHRVADPPVGRVTAQPVHEDDDRRRFGVRRRRAIKHIWIGSGVRARRRGLRRGGGGERKNEQRKKQCMSSGADRRHH